MEEAKHGEIMVSTLGHYQVVDYVKGTIDHKSWGRDKTVQLLQYLVTYRRKRLIHKEHIIDGLWPDANDGDRDFKVAMHGINKVLEPTRASRVEPRYIIRQGVSYGLEDALVTIDAHLFEAFITLANKAVGHDNSTAQQAYEEALSYYQGPYLPNRLYEDWCSGERERLQVLALGAHLALSQLVIDQSPLEAIRLAQQALAIDNTWEDAYRIQMLAYLKTNNRPQVVKTYEACCAMLDEEFGMKPLPETTAIYNQVL